MQLNFSDPHKSYCDPLIFHHSLLAPQKLPVTFWGPTLPTLTTTNLQDFSNSDGCALHAIGLVGCKGFFQFMQLCFTSCRTHLIYMILLMQVAVLYITQDLSDLCYKFCYGNDANICSFILTFRHRASCILGQAFHCSPENAFYIFKQ